MDYRYEFVFSKKDEMIYLSHLDLMRLFARAARRADLPVALTKGFNPHFRLRLKRALKLGVASEAETGEIFLMEARSAEEIKKKWQQEMPQGLEIKDVRTVV